MQICPRNCSGNGECMRGVNCLCDMGWVGADCAVPVSEIQIDAVRQASIPPFNGKTNVR